MKIFVVIAHHQGSGHGPASNTVLVTEEGQMVRLVATEEEMGKLGYRFTPDADQGIMIEILQTEEPYAQHDHESIGDRPRTTHHAHSLFRRKTADGWKNEYSSAITFDVFD